MSDGMATMQRTGTISRRGFGLGLGALLSSVVAPRVGATKKGENRLPSIKKRVKIQTQNCEDLGGTATTTVRPGGTSVSCKGGANDGLNCVNSTKRTRCYQDLRTPPPAVPTVPPTGGVADEPSGGGVHPKGGESTQPTEGVEDPSSPSSSEPVVE